MSCHSNCECETCRLQLALSRAQSAAMRAAAYAESNPRAVGYALDALQQVKVAEHAHARAWANPCSQIGYNAMRKVELAAQAAEDAAFYAKRGF